MATSVFQAELAGNLVLDALGCTFGLWATGIASLQLEARRGVKVLETLGYTFAINEWKAPAGAPVSLVAEADRMHALLVHRADARGAPP